MKAVGRSVAAVLGALVASLVVLDSAPASAQIFFCSSRKCTFTECHLEYPSGLVVCTDHDAACYFMFNGPCTCPVPGGSACSLHRPTNLAPTAEELAQEGIRTCHELLRTRLHLDRGVELFDRESISVIPTGRSGVAVSGLAHPKIPFDFHPVDEAGRSSRRFECEVERRDDGTWEQRVLEVSEEGK